MVSSSDAPHLPRSAPIEAYGKGGFAFADMSHRGSLLCLPDGIWAWPIARIEDLTEDALSMVFARVGALDFFILGTGSVQWNVPPSLRARFRDARISLDAMTTGPAVRPYNVTLMESPRVCAGL